MMANAVNKTERHKRKKEAWDRSQWNDEGKIRRIWKGDDEGIFGVGTSE
jgi:hypothetical protein